MTLRAQSKFRQRCQSAADLIGIDVDFIADSRESDAFEDDGTLHVVRNGLRAMFDVSNGQNDSGTKQNAKTGKVMQYLKLDLTDRVLVDDDDTDDACPHCGRSY